MVSSLLDPDGALGGDEMKMGRLVPAMLVSILLGAVGCSSEPSDPKKGETPKAEILGFVASAQDISAGSEIELHWMTRNAVALELSSDLDGAIELGDADLEEGSITVRPSAKTVYTLRAIGAGGDSVEQELEVQVTSGLSASLSATPTKIDPGGAATLSWSTHEATSVSLSDGSEELLETQDQWSGELSVSPSTTTTYTLKATSGEEEQTSTVVVEVNPLVIEFVAIAEGPFVVGDPVELSWEIAGATEASISSPDGEELAIEPSSLAEGSASLVIGAQGYFLLTARSGALEARQELQLQLLGIPSIISFTASPEVVTAGQEVTLSWEVEGADDLILELNGTSVPVEGDSHVVAIEENTSLTLIATNAAGQATETIEVVAEAVVYEAPRILAFSVEPVRSTQGEPLTFTFEVESDARGPAPTLAIHDPADGAVYEISPSDALAGSTTFALAAAGDRSLLLVASTPDTDDGSRAAPVEILPEPTVKLSSSIASYVDAPAELSWTSEHAVSAALYELDSDFRLILPALFESSDPAEVRGEGVSIPVIPQPPETSYRLIVTNELDASRQSSVTVERLPVAIDSFTVDRSETVATIQPVEFSWSTKRASQVWIEPSDFRTGDAFLDISGSETAEQLQLSDGCQVDASSGDPMECGGFDFPAGFEFPYYGKVYTKARASTHGFLSFDLRYPGEFKDSENCSRGSCTYGVFPHGVSRAVHLAPFWRSLSVFEGGTRPGKVLMDLGQDQSGRFLVIQWKGMHLGSIGLPTDVRTDINFQIILWENGNFDFRYGELRLLQWGDAAAMLAIGYQDPTATEGKTLKSDSSTGGEFIGGLEGWAFAMRPAGLPTSGSWSAYPLQGGTYTLVATDGANNRTETQSLTVHPRAWWPAGGPVPFVGSSAPAAPNPGDVISVSWSQTQNATAIDVEDENGNKLCGVTDPAKFLFGSCSFTENRSGELVYTVRAHGAGGAALGNVATIRAVAPIYAPPLIQSLRATPSPLTPGETAVLSWVIDDATSITLTEKIGSDPAAPIDVSGISPTNGSVVVSPATSAIYTLVATRQETFTNKSSNTTYQLPVDTVRMSDLSATKTNLQAGESSTLSWSAAGEGTVSVGPLPMRSMPLAFHDISESETKNTISWGALSGGTRAATITFPEDFSFRYFGEAHASIHVIEDGSLSFENKSGNPHQYGYPAVGGLGNVLPSTRIGPFWAELKAYNVGEVFWERFQIGGDDFIVIQYNRFHLPVLPAPAAGAETDELTFQVVLFNDGASQDGRFDFRYLTMTSDNNQEGADGKAASIGFQSTDGKRSSELAFYEAVTGGLSGRSWRFEPIDLSTGTMTVTPWKTTDYKACIADGTRTICETIRITVPALGDLLITELQLQPAAGSAQWFEVRNTSVGPIDMNGMSIVANGGSHTIANGGPLVVLPGEFLTFAASTSPGFTPSYSYGAFPVLNPAGDRLTIYNGTNPEALIAEARWQGWTLAEGRSKSLELSRHRPGLLSDRDESSWCTEGTQSYVAGNFGTPGATGRGCLPGLYTLDAYSADPFIDIEGTGTKLTIGTGRNPPVSAVVPGGIGFDMPFFDGTVSDLWISQNGVVGLGSSHANHKSRAIPGTGTGLNAGFVAGHWSNWALGPTANNAAFLYEKQERGGKKVTILQWTRVTTTVWVDPLFPPMNPLPPDPGEGTFQVQLWEDGDIVIVYESLLRGLRARGSETSVGIEAPGGTTGVRYSWNEPVLKTGQSLRYQLKQQPAP